MRADTKRKIAHQVGVTMRRNWSHIKPCSICGKRKYRNGVYDKKLGYTCRQCFDKWDKDQPRPWAHKH